MWSLNTVERFDGRRCWRATADISPCTSLDAISAEHADDWLSQPLEVGQ